MGWTTSPLSKNLNTRFFFWAGGGGVEGEKGGRGYSAVVDTKRLGGIMTNSIG